MTKKYTLKRDVYLSWEILGSDAFKELSSSAICVLLRFLQKRTWHKKRGRGKPIFNNEGLSFTYAEAAYLGVRNTTFYEAIKQLIRVGLLDLQHQGGAFGRDFSRYAISERWRDYGTANFRRVEKKRSLQRGMDVRSNMSRKNKNSYGKP